MKTQDPKPTLKSLFLKFIVSRISISRLAIPLILASVVGCLTGLLIVGFIWFIDFLKHFFMVEGVNALSLLGRYAIIFIPAIGGLIVGLIVTFLSPEAKGHGVPEVMKAIALQGGRIHPRVIFGKAVASAIAIGSGASVGREGPIVQSGAALGSVFARFFRLSESRVKNMVACGAAAGIAGVFNAPIAGVMFSLEVILRDFGARALSTVVVAAVSSSIVSHIFLGQSPAFTVPFYRLWSPWEIFLYIVLGALSAFTALSFVAILHKSEDFFESLKQVPAWVKPAIGGLLLGCIGFFYPQVFGSGLETIEEVLHGELAWHLLLTLVFLKMISTSISLGSGTSGGVFAPALFIGAVLGGAVGNLFFRTMPFPVAPPGAYALVGMASVFSGAAHAPVTAILIVFEMTGDYHMILPIMVAVVVATSLAQFLKRESIYTEKLKHKGIDIDSLEEVHVLGAIQVRDAMSEAFITVPRNKPIGELVEEMTADKGKVIYVVNKKNHLVGVISPERIHEVMFEKDLPLFIADDLVALCEEACFPDDSLTEIAHFMMHHNLTQIPVVDPQNEHSVIGVLKSEHIFKAYTQMSAKREHLIGRLEQQKSSAQGAIQNHFIIPARSSIVGKAIAELELPEGVVITTIKRKNGVVIPRGDTQLKSHDHVWIIVVPESEDAFKAWLKTKRLDKYSFFG